MSVPSVLTSNRTITNNGLEQTAATLKMNNIFAPTIADQAVDENINPNSANAGYASPNDKVKSTTSKVEEKFFLNKVRKQHILNQTRKPGKF